MKSEVTHGTTIVAGGTFCPFHHFSTFNDGSDLLEVVGARKGNNGATSNQAGDEKRELHFECWRLLADGKCWIVLIVF
jgi:hypothetical protein